MPIFAPGLDIGHGVQNGGQERVQPEEQISPFPHADIGEVFRFQQDLASRWIDLYNTWVKKTFLVFTLTMAVIFSSGCLQRQPPVNRYFECKFETLVDQKEGGEAAILKALFHQVSPMVHANTGFEIRIESQCFDLKA